MTEYLQQLTPDGAPSLRLTDLSWQQSQAPFSFRFIEISREHDELLVPWTWGADSTGAIAGSILSIGLAITFGFQGVLYIAGVVYFIGVAALISVKPAGSAEGSLRSGPAPRSG